MIVTQTLDQSRRDGLHHTESVKELSKVHSILSK
jgi:hypothetical protein